MTPLEIFRQIWTDKIPPSVITYVESVNVNVDLENAPNPWASAFIQGEARQDVTLGSAPWVEETGTFVIGLFTRSGGGPDVLDTQIDYVRTAFAGAAYGGLVILQVDGPHDVDPAGFGEWFQVALTARYIFQTRRDATGHLYGDWQGFPTTPPPPLPGP